MSLATAHPAAVTGIGDQARGTSHSTCTARPAPVDQAERNATAMTGRATFGDLAGSASRLLQAPAQHLPVTGPLSPGQVAAQADEFLAVLPRLLKTMARYAADIAAPATEPASGTRHQQPSSWARAAGEVRQAAQNACQALPPEELTGRSWQHRQLTSSMTRELDAAASVITAARDLLHTHSGTSADGTLWVPIIPVTLCDLGILVDQSAEPVPAQNACTGHFGRRMRASGGRLLLQ
jgi:hypothetical protein